MKIAFTPKLLPLAERTAHSGVLEQRRFKVPQIALILGLWAQMLGTTSAEPAKEDTKASLEVISLLAKLPPPDASTEAGTHRENLIAKVKHFSKQPKVWLNLGDALAQESRESGSEALYPHAEAIYQQALTLKPDCVEAMTGIAWSLGGRHLFPESIVMANKAISLSSESAAAYGIIGDAELELGHYEEALTAYQKMIDLKPDLSSWSRGAYLLWLTGQKSKGMWLMERAIKAGGPFAENTAWCRSRLALMQIHDGLAIVAMQTLAPSLTPDTKNAHVLLAAAKAEVCLNHLEKAATYLDRIIAHRPQHDALALRADIATAQGDAAMTEHLVLQIEALEKKHRSTAGHGHLAVAKFFADREMNLLEALALAERFQTSKNIFEADAVAWIYHKAGEPTKAATAIKTALKHSTPDPEIYFHAGMICLANGDSTTARKHLLKALSLNPRFSLTNAEIAQQKLAELGSVTLNETKQ